MPPTDLLAEFSRKCAAKGRLFEAQIELTHRCNLRCLHCYIHHASLPPESAVENWKATLDQLVDMGLCMVTFTGGEPLLHPGLEELIAHAFGKGCQVRIFSNANLFQDKAHVDRLRTAGLCYLETSIYGANADSHDAITLVPGSFEKTLRAVRWCQEAGIAVTMKTSWMKQNWREYPRVVALAREWGVFFRGSPSLMPRLDGDLANQDHGMSYEELVEFYSMDESNAAPRETGADSSGDTLDAPPCGIARLSMATSPAGDAYPCLH
ncbi:MAG TPA: radical SAM protein, partial [Kiritimatiellia bacterium]|nr:radical SAM protein [Kiritimatiellia bacterium]